MNKKIVYGNVDPFPAQPSSKDESIRISIVIEGDLLDQLKAKASSEAMPYQTLMKQLLRKALNEKASGDFEARLEAVEEQVKKAVAIASRRKKNGQWVNADSKHPRVKKAAKKKKRA